MAKIIMHIEQIYLVVNFIYFLYLVDINYKVFKQKLQCQKRKNIHYKFKLK